MPGFSEPHPVHRRFWVCTRSPYWLLSYAGSTSNPELHLRAKASFEPKYFYYAFFVGVAPLLVLRFRSLISYVISPFSLWALGYITLNIIHLLLAVIDGEPSRADIIGTKIQYAVLTVALGFACSITRTTSTSVSFRSWPFLSRSR